MQLENPSTQPPTIHLFQNKEQGAHARQRLIVPAARHVGLADANALGADFVAGDRVGDLPPDVVVAGQVPQGELLVRAARGRRRDHRVGLRRPGALQIACVGRQINAVVALQEEGQIREEEEEE